MSPPHSTHFVQLFQSDESLIDAASRYVRDTIEAGSTCIALTTLAHRECIATRLASLGMNSESLVSTYRYITLNAHQALERLMTDERLDRQQFHRNMGLLIRQAASSGTPVCVFSELVPLLLAAGRSRCAIQLEDLWNELSRLHRFTLCCAYPLADAARDPATRERVCAMHERVVPACN